MYILSKPKLVYVGKLSLGNCCGSKLLDSLCSLSVVWSQSSYRTLVRFRRQKCFCFLGSSKQRRHNQSLFIKMGLSNFPSAAEGVLPVLVMNTVLSVALLKNMVRSLLQVMGATASDSPSNLDDESDEFINSNSEENGRERRISITQFKSLCDSRSSVTRSNSSSTGWAATECCVCLNGFQADEEVSELSCNHFFHKGCLDKWFDNKHTTCPLCRSIL